MFCSSTTGSNYSHSFSWSGTPVRQLFRSQDAFWIDCVKVPSSPAYITLGWAEGLQTSTCGLPLEWLSMEKTSLPPPTECGGAMQLLTDNGAVVTSGNCTEVDAVIAKRGGRPPLSKAGRFFRKDYE